MMILLAIGLMIVVLGFWILFILRNGRRIAARSRKNKPLRWLSIRV